ncbi:helix-turn-helix domain-containing protein [Streptomyces sioyaensis]|uniref:helix-turn-helix domain-containing protein n=1 Tax=Streptomyces sioyaensis TaxID=67364 RepID=UPI001F2D0A79|nr:helix-turn-helix domain-containing protein [Streptomyces sioyaensis]
MTHIRSYQPDRYTIIGNHLAQHRDLSLTAIGVGTHILSLPEGAAVDIRTLAARFPEGRDRIAFALRELEAHGYVERVRERTADGRVITRTYAHNAPDVPGQEEAAPPPPAPAEPRRPVRAAQAPGPAVEAPVEAPSGEHHAPARALLAALRRTDDRLTLPARDVRRLAPAVAAWFENGATAAAVHRTLTAALPPDLKNPAGLLAHRLRELLPPPLPTGREAAPGAGAPLPPPLQTCDGCDRAFRAREPGRCRDCRGEPVSGEPAVAA